MISIQNLYYLLCYAWNRLPERDDLVTTSPTEFHRPLELLAQVLLTGMRRLLQQGLKNAYSEREEEVQALRGRLLLTPSLHRDLLRQGRAVCTYDELGPDSVFNRLLLGTLEQLTRSQLLLPAQRYELRLLRNRFPASLAPAPFTQHTLRQVRRQRLSGPESFLLNVCELIYYSALPEPDATGRTRFRDFRRDERLMAQLFEAFVRNFYRYEQQQFRVFSEKITWQANAEQPENMHLLPSMITDTTLDSAARKIILDTKYYTAALRQRYDRQRLIAPHLYQLYAYLQNQPLADGQQLEGILLYPAATQEVDLRYTLGGHPVRIVTLDLNQPWPGIARDLLGLINNDPKIKS